jgi:NitT/TauT family transport system permease protein
MSETVKRTSAATPVQISRPRTWWERNGSRTTVIGIRVALLVVLVVCWQLASGRLVDPLFISSPTAIWDRLVGWAGSGVLWSNSWITIREIVIGYVLGAVAGVIFGFVIASQRLLHRVLDPFIMSLYSIPKVALAPLFIVWLGIGIEMKIVLAAVTVFFLVFLNTAAGVRDVDRGLIDAARLMSARRRDLILKVILPASMSGVLTGLRVSIPYALIGAMIGELVASNRGLGYLINNGAATFDTAGVFAALIVLTVIAAILNGLVNLLDRYANKWRPADD